jgi:hypothetical protein
MAFWKDLQWLAPQGRVPLDRIAREALAAPGFPWDLELPVLVDDQGQPLPSLEEARGFLQIASQIEHGLMIEYLYAAYTAAEETSWDISKRDTLTRIQLGIRKIAQEEMGHLITVQNLIVLCGAADANLKRQDQDAHPDWDPFPFQLAPLSLQTLARFTVCESPQNPGDITELINLAGEGLSTRVKRVGGLYMKLYWLFLPNNQPAPDQNPWQAFDPVAFLREYPDQRDRHIRDADLVGSTALSQTQSPDWRRSNPNELKIFYAANRMDALKALTQIIEQGEGPTSTEGSHFHRFKGFFDNAKSKKVTPRLASETKYVIDPTTDSNRKHGKLIVNQVPAALSDLLDSFYRSIIAETLLSMLSKYKTKRQSLTNYAVKDMRMVTDIASEIVKHDLDDAHPSIKAGPAFMPAAPDQPAGQDPLTAYNAANTQSRKALARLEQIKARLSAGLQMSLGDWADQVNNREGLARALSQIV